MSENFFADDFLIYLNDRPRQEFKRKPVVIQYLLLEGKTDVKFCKTVFKYKFPYNGIELDIDFSNRSKPFVMSTDVIEQFLGVNDRDNKAELIISTMRRYTSNKSQYESIALYGFIDRDYGHNVADINQIAQTSERDLETNLLWKHLPDYIRSIRDEEVRRKMINNVSKVLTFTVEQGLIGKASWDYSLTIDDYKNDDIHYASHTYFKNNKKLEDFTEKGYMDYYIKDELFPISETFKNYCKKSIERFGIDFIDALPEYVNEWINDKMSLLAKRRLERCFELSNGHMFIRQFIIANRDFYGIDICDQNINYQLNLVEKKEEEVFNELVNATKNNQSAIYSLNPLHNYRIWRLKNFYK